MKSIFKDVCLIMSVSVYYLAFLPSPAGIEYRCYPFQMDLVLPFLPKSKAGRVLSSGPDNRGTMEVSGKNVDQNAAVD